MADKIGDILYFKYPTQMTAGQIVVTEDAQGNQYIAKWQMGSIPKPSDAEVMALVNDNDYKYNKAIYGRLNDPVLGYKPLAEQVDMMFHDLQNNTQTLQTHRNTVKYINYPRPSNPNANTDITQIVVRKRNSVSASFKELVIAQASSTQAISGTTKQTVLFGTKLNDQNSMFTNGIYTALTGGIYEVTVTIQVENAALALITAFYNWEIYLTTTISNSTSYYLLNRYTHGLLSAAPATLQGTLMNPIALAAGDKLSVNIQKNLATSLNITSAMLNIKKICEA